MFADLQCDFNCTGCKSEKDQYRYYFKMSKILSKHQQQYIYSTLKPEMYATEKYLICPIITVVINNGGKCQEACLPSYVSDKFSGCHGCV